MNQPDRRNTKLYRPSELPRFLPDPEELFHQLEVPADRIKFVHPVSGKWVVYRRTRRKH